MPLIGGEMFPETDNGYIQLRFKTPVGSSLEYTDLKVKQVEAALKEFTRKSTASRPPSAPRTAATRRRST